MLDILKGPECHMSTVWKVKGSLEAKLSRQQIKQILNDECVLVMFSCLNGYTVYNQ